MELKGRFVPYNPPVDPVRDDDPAVLTPTLEAAGIRLEINNRGFRCSNCGTMQRMGSSMAYVNDGIQIGDAWITIVEGARNRWNSHGSGWCFDCTTKLLPNAARRAASPRKSWLRRLLGR